MTEEEPGARSGPDVESMIGSVLRYGVIASALLIIAGLLLAPFRIGPYSGFPSTLTGIIGTGYGKPVYSLSQLAAGLLQPNPLSIMEVGVVVLIAIPFFRVAVGGAMFLSEKNWKYVVISALVLGVLLLGTFVVGPYEAGR